MKLSSELLNLLSNLSKQQVEPGETDTKAMPEKMLRIIIATSKNYELFAEFSEKRKNLGSRLKLLPVFSSQNPRIFEFLRFLRLLGREKPSIVHFQYPLSPLNLVFFLLFLKGRTFFWKLFFRKFKENKQKHEFELSLFYTAHNAMPHAKKIYGYFFYKIFLRSMQKVIVHSEDDKKAIAKLGISKDKIAVIEHGIVFDKPKISKSQAREELGISAARKRIKGRARVNEVVFLFFGYISEKKGIRELLIAFKNACEKIESKDKVIKLVIAGSESKGFDIRKELKALGIRGAGVGDKEKKDEEKKEGCRIYIDRAYIRKRKAELYFKACDVLILPYRTEKHSPLVQVAYYFGMPVIASDKQKESILDGKTGYIFRSGNAKELEEAIIKLSNEENLRELSKNALKESRKYSWKKIAEKTINAYCID